MTSDNRKELATHESIANHLGTDFYFAHLYASYERDLNEYNMDLSGNTFPKVETLEPSHMMK